MTNEIKFSAAIISSPFTITRAVDPIGDQLRDLNDFINFALSHLTIEEFKKALQDAIHYKSGIYPDR